MSRRPTSTPPPLELAPPLRAAIYARKSNEQDAADEHKSVTRQIEGGRRMIADRGWAIEHDDHVLVDDGISGAEFSRRPGFVRLMALIAQKPRPFDVLVMSEGSRLGRESIETAYVLKQLIKAGIRVFSYLDGRELKLDTPIEKFMMQVGNFADEMERHRTRARVTDAMAQRARAGQVTGGRTPYGYRDVVGVDGAGRRTVTRAIDPDEAVIVVRIHTRAAEGAGNHRIARELNEDRVPPPRNRTSRRRAVWAPNGIANILARPLYRGINRWNQTSAANTWGERRVVRRPPSEWIDQPMPHLRIVSDVLWRRVHDRRTRRRASMETSAPTFRNRRARDGDSPFLLVGFARCGDCGGPLSVLRENGKHVYVCGDRRRRGTAACTNATYMPMGVLDRAIVETIERDLFSPEMRREIVEAARAPRAAAAATVPALRRELEQLEREIDNLGEAIAAGGRVDVLVRKMTERQTRRDVVQQELVAASAAPTSPRQRRGELEALLDAAMTSGRLALKEIASARRLLRDLLQERPLKVWGTSAKGAAPSVRFAGELDLAIVFEGVAGAPVQLPRSGSGSSQRYRPFAGTAAA